MKLIEILQEEARLAGKKQMEEDEYGVKRFWINNQHLIHLRSSLNDRYFYLYAKIAALPSPALQIKTYEGLLEANLFGEELCSLAIHLQSKSVILTRTFESATTSYLMYEEGFQTFMNYLVFWKEKIKTFGPSAEKTQEDMLNIMSRRNQKIIFI